jgi:anti-anti-sigma factor
MFHIVKASNSSMVISVAGTSRLNFLNIDELISDVNSLINSSCRKIYLDLKGVSFMDSKAFESLITINEQCSQYAIDFCCCNVSDELQELFSLVNNDNKIKTCTRAEMDVPTLIEVLLTN